MEPNHINTPEIQNNTIFHPNVTTKIWFESIILSLLTFFILLLYATVQMDSFSILTVSTALAGTGGVLIGISFALSGLCYYFNFLDKKIAYRKYIGLLGYYFALAYTLSLVFINPDKYLFGFFLNLFTYEFILGISAMGILTMMAIISNNSAMKKLGVNKWRELLRFGYLAYFFLILRAIILDYDTWIIWIKYMNFLPPLRLILTVFAITVLLLRTSMFIFRKRN